MTGRRRFARDRQGRFHPRLEPPEQELLGSLPRQAQSLLAEDDPAAARLFPVAYPGDADAESDYRSLMGGALLARHQYALDTLASTAASASIDEDELQ
ncbi:MAG: DUF2017 family protein, partial [Acidimicrobiales bacterium]